MEIEKNYPWAKNLKVSEKDFKKWLDEGKKESFVFWSLKNRVINSKAYFKWAIEHYEIPFLNDLFFEQHLMRKQQWKKVKDLSEWTQEEMPVAVWDDIVFIGCLKPPSKDKSYNYEHRFVLTTEKSLQTIWNFTNTLSKSLEKDAKKSKTKDKSIDSPSQPQVNFQLKNKEPFIEKDKAKELNQSSETMPALEKTQSKIIQLKNLVQNKSESSLKVENRKTKEEKFQSVSKVENIESINAKLQEKALKDKESLKETTQLKNPSKTINNKLTNQVFTPTNPPKTKHPIPRHLIESSIDQTSTAQSSFQKSNLLTGSKEAKHSVLSDEKSVSLEKSAPQLKASFPEDEEERFVEKEFDTFPNRCVEKTDDMLIKGKTEVLLEKNTQSKDKKEIVISTVGKASDTEKEKNTTEGTLYKMVSQGKEYKILWKQTKFFFKTSMVLEVKDNKVYLFLWSGYMNINDKNEELANLEDRSLFKVLRRGYPYHGFAVQTPANKKFFQNIGWKDFPKHVTAIPIKNEKQELKQIFVGLSTKTFSKSEIKKIEGIVSNFFQSDEKSLHQVA